MTITCLLWLFLSLIHTRLVCAVFTEKPVSGGLIRLRCTLLSLLAPLLIKSQDVTRLDSQGDLTNML